MDEVVSQNLRAWAEDDAPGHPAPGERGHGQAGMNLVVASSATHSQRLPGVWRAVVQSSSN